MSKGHGGDNYALRNYSTNLFNLWSMTFISYLLKLFNKLLGFAS